MDAVKFDLEQAAAMGMCTGLRRILSRVEQRLTKSTAVVLGDFVHNPLVYEDLERRGARRVDEVGGVRHGDTVVIGPHGHRPSLRSSIEDAGGHVLDASCPRVMRVIEAGMDMAHDGLAVVFVGQSGHEEAQMLRELVAELYVLEEPFETRTLPMQLGVVAQSTITQAHYARVIARLRSTGRDLIVADTICPETIARQDAATELAQRVDVVVVVGAERSHNTMALAETCAGVTRTVVVNGAAELDPGDFNDVARVGVTAGASTPDAVVRGVIRRLRAIAEGE